MCYRSNIDTINHDSKGFTLIELMIVVVIIGILSAIAVPSYRDYVLRGYLVDATTALSSLRARMEQHFQDNRSYASVTGFPSPCVSSTVGKFNITCTPTATTYTATATGTGPVAGFTFTIDQQNSQATTASAWPSSTGACWITKKGGTC